MGTGWELDLVGLDLVLELDPVLGVGSGAGVLGFGLMLE